METTCTHIDACQSGNVPLSFDMYLPIFSLDKTDMALFANLFGYVIIEPLSAKNHFTLLLAIFGIMQKHPLDITIEN